VYRVIPDDAVFEQVAALPFEALPSYAEALTVLEVAPANGRPYNADYPERPMREWVFGVHGEGTITYLMLDDMREVHVLLVQWAG
jgi:hypothetical protein